MATDITLELYRSSLSGRLESGASPDGTFRHGDVFILSDASIPSSTVYQREFSGGVDGIVEGLIVGATIANQGNWRFDNAAHNPVVYDDSERGKVMHNDYFAQADIDATKRVMLTGSLGYGEKLYYARWVRPVIKTTGPSDYPMTSQLQWKTERFIATDSIEDSGGANTATELLLSNWFAGNGKNYYWETGDGNITGSSTGTGTAYTITDSTKNYGVNTLTRRGIDLTGGTGSGQHRTIISNTATTITVSQPFSPIPDATTTFHVTNALVQGANEMLINSGWQFVEWFITANTNGNADGSFIKKVWRDGVLYTCINQTGVQLYAGSAKYKYIQAQDFFGNAVLPVVSKNVYCDDIFLKHGAFDRVLLMDTTSISTMTKFATQLDSAWSAGSISGKLNTAGLTAGTYYLCAITGVDTVVYSTEVEIVI